MISAEEARARLQEGNRRFVAGIRSPETARSYTRSVELVVEQRPFATILGCSDARVPPEIVFDQGLSDLFVIRVAGSVADSTQIGSIEYAVMKLGTPLVVVLGHSRCGGVLATIEQMQRRAENLSPNLVSIIDHIRPAIESLLSSSPSQSVSAALIQQAVRANVRASVESLARSSAVLKQLIEDNKLTVVGADYSLDTGVVEFFD